MAYSKGLSLDQNAAGCAPLRPWAPKELGLTKAALLSLLLAAAILALCLYAAGMLEPTKPAAIQVTQVQLVTLPAPTPPPQMLAPPKPLPALIPKPLPVPSRIHVATKTPPTRHAYKRIPRPAVIRAPQLQLPVQKPAPPQPAAQPISGLPIYGAQMHAVLQANQDVPPSLAQLGISGTAYVQIIVAPDGHPVSAKIYRSSGNALIDQTALQHAMQANYGAFNAQMPIIAQTFIIPVDIQPQDQ